MLSILPVDQLVGKTVGVYSLMRLLGQGKLSSVYMAQHSVTGQPAMVTVVLIPEEFTSQARERFLTRFTREGAALVKLQHPHILPVHTYGEEFGYPYLVTPFVQGSSLSKALKQEGYFTPERALEILKPIAEGLDYAHDHDVIHGALSSANILLSDEYVAQVAGFGLVRMLEIHGIEESSYPYPHLYSIAGTVLGTPAYTAPEFVLGQVIDGRVDVYALGVILFELLTGTLPFAGTNPLEQAVQHSQQPVPSLHAVRPEISAAFDLVIQKALERDPSQRFQSASDLVQAYNRVLKVLYEASSLSGPLNLIDVRGTQKTLPSTVNWFADEVFSSDNNGNKQTSAAINPASLSSQTTLHDSPTRSGSYDENIEAIDPFVWWSTTSSLASVGGKVTGTLSSRPTTRLASRQLPALRRRPTLKERRQVLTLLAIGGVAVGGALGFGAFQFLLRPKQAQTALRTSAPPTTPVHNSGTTPTPVSTPVKAQQTPASRPTPRPTHQTQATSTPALQATPTPTAVPPTPTSVPTPTPTPQPSHTGTVIGSTSQPTNSGSNFTNPADGNRSILVHLLSGNFAAYERACTHAGVNVNYDSGSHQLVCPAHGAIFDPANNGAVVQGPANSPLQGISIRVNSDGTITTG
jgi:serine/threonine protein kinase/nitrite reductase/ring-hydroxylating ferredoxin subunit